MGNAQTEDLYNEDVETAMLDVELFLKYKSTRRARERLQEAVRAHPQSLKLREKWRELAAADGEAQEAARQCLALATLYIARDNFGAAHERLLEARRLDPRINITPGLEAIRRARRPDALLPVALPLTRPAVTFAGDLSAISFFDAVQVIENARLTGTLVISRDDAGERRIFFNDGQIVGAQEGSGGATDGQATLRHTLALTAGAFGFTRTAAPHPVTIQAGSNTSLLLDALRELDEQNNK